jgi:protein TonB
MFSELVESAAVKKQTQNGWPFMASAIAQSLCLMAAFLIPLIYTQALPKKIMNAFLIAPAPSPRPAAAPPNTAPRVRPRGQAIVDNILRAPVFIPQTVEMTPEPPLPSEVSTDSPADGPGSVNLLEDTPTSPPAPTPQPLPQPPAPIALQRIKQGGIVQAAKLIHQPQPIYPVLARQTGIQGAVVLRAVIDHDGDVSELQVISGHPLLVQAALNAVKQWRYQPTLLNGEPVEVETTITVSFVLGG